MKFLIMLTIVGAVISVWCPIGYADRLYTWEDDNGVTHISKEPPPQKAKLIDIMDYTESNASKNQTAGGQISNEAANSQPQRIEAQKKEKVTGATDTTEDVEEEVYYDSDGGLYTKRAIIYEKREARREQRENRQENDRRLEDRQDRQKNREERKDARQEKRENHSKSDSSIRKPQRRQSHGRK